MHLMIAFAASGCAQGSPVGLTEPYFGTRQTSAGPATQHFYGNWVYSSQPSDNEVIVDKRERNGFMLTNFETLTSGFSAPMGMATTVGGWLYIANSGDSNVLVYRSTRTGPNGPKATLRDDGEVPVNVAVTPSRQIVAVSNGSTTESGAGSLGIYLNQQHRPSRALTYGSDPIQGEGAAIDSNGNCYWSFNDPNTLAGSIVEFVGCNGNGSLIKSGILRAGGITFDQSGNLYYVDQLTGIYKCNGTSSCSIFAPIGGSGGLVIPTNINFDNRIPQNLWVADAIGYIDAVNVSGLVVYTLQAIGGILDPPIGIAPAPGS
jgi:DNA-binding beta-propeller fold protein YncE